MIRSDLCFPQTQRFCHLSVPVYVSYASICYLRFPAIPLPHHSTAIFSHSLRHLHPRPVYYMAKSFEDAKKRMRVFSDALHRPFHVRFSARTQTLQVCQWPPCPSLYSVKWIVYSVKRKACIPCKVGSNSLLNFLPLSLSLSSTFSLFLWTDSRFFAVYLWDVCSRVLALSRAHRWTAPFA